MTLQLHILPLYLALVIALWLITYHLVYWSLAIIRSPSLLCWSIGPLGLAVVSLHALPPRRILAQLGGAGLTLAGMIYLTLFGVHPAPVSGFDERPLTQVGVVVIPVAVVTLARLVSTAWERRLPLWGEAGVLMRVQRSLATGGRIYFTPRGRAFIRERFGATPGEFLRMVR